MFSCLPADAFLLLSMWRPKAQLEGVPSIEMKDTEDEALEGGAGAASRIKILGMPARKLKSLAKPVHTTHNLLNCSSAIAAPFDVFSEWAKQPSPFLTECKVIPNALSARYPC